MAVDKAVDSGTLDDGLETVADAIRTVTRTNAPLPFPAGMAGALDELRSAEGVSF